MKMYIRKFFVVSCLLSFGAVYGAACNKKCTVKSLMRTPVGGPARIEIENNKKITRLFEIISRAGNEGLEFFQDKNNMCDFLNVVRVLSPEECNNFLSLLTNEGATYLRLILSHNSDRSIQNVETLNEFISSYFIELGHNIGE